MELRAQKPLEKIKVKELCDDCKVVYSNADQDEKKQEQQVESAITQGAKVVVLDPVNGAGAGGMHQGSATMACQGLKI